MNKISMQELEGIVEVSPPIRPHNHEIRVVFVKMRGIAEFLSGRKVDVYYSVSVPSSTPEGLRKAHDMLLRLANEPAEIGFLLHLEKLHFMRAGKYKPKYRAVRDVEWKPWIIKRGAA
jgi:hypothetical protein